MIDSRTAALRDLRQGLGNPRPPQTIRQEAFEFEPAHLHRLAGLPPDVLPRPRDLFDYMEDVRYARGEIQAELLLWVLPYWLAVWWDDLIREDTGYGSVVEALYDCLGSPRVAAVLTVRQRDAIGDFMRRGLNQEIDRQQGLTYSGAHARPYRWVYAHASYGSLFPSIEQLWRDWWTLETRGRATAAIQLVSCLIYGEKGNKVFAPWTPEEGGGPPCLWQHAGLIEDEPWLAPNVAFLRGFLVTERLLESVGQAAARLAAELEAAIAETVAKDASAHQDVLARRCSLLPEILGHRAAHGALRDW